MIKNKRKYQKIQSSEKQTHDSGRSMVEMLGVLVLIGLVGIVSILGFRQVMNSYKASQVQETAAQVKALMGTKRLSTATRAKSFLNKTSMRGYNVNVEDFPVDDSATVIRVTLENVPESVQYSIYANKDNYAQMGILVLPSEKITETLSKDEWVSAGMDADEFDSLNTKISLEKEMTTLSYAFIKHSRRHNNVPRQFAPTLDSTNDVLSTCPATRPYLLDGKCYICDPLSNTHWENGKGCVANSCPAGQRWDFLTGTCLSSSNCPEGMCGDDCTILCITVNDLCVAPKLVWSDSENRCVCPLGQYEKNDECVECLINEHCEDERPICSLDNICISCAEDNADKPYWNGSTCIACTGGQVWDATSKTCVCPTEKPNWNGSTCIACTGGQIWNATSKTCICPAEKPNWNGSTCIACTGGQVWDATSKTCICPAEKPNWNGSTCIACTGGQVWNATSKTCVCPTDKPNWNGSTCIACTGGQVWNATSKTCVCPTDKPNWNGTTCIACTGGQVWNATSKTCVCPKEKPNWNGTTCIACTGGQVWDDTLKICVCPLTKPNWNGTTCIACTGGQVWDSETESCVCPTDKPYWIDSMCVECIKNEHCTNNTKPMCISNVCTPCPSGTGLIIENGDKTCKPYCIDEDKTGLILLIDRSESTKKNGRAEAIDATLQALNIPENIETAVYYNRSSGYKALSYGQHALDELEHYFSAENRGYDSISNGTTFYYPFSDISDNVCTGNEKFNMMLWTDAYNLKSETSTITEIKEIKNMCVGSKLYVISPETDSYESVVDKHFDVNELPNDEYTNLLNSEIDKDYCISSPCVSSAPIWNGSKCVECSKNKHCKDATKPICSSSTNTCVGCSVGTVLTRLNGNDNGNSGEKVCMKQCDADEKSGLVLLIDRSISTTYNNVDKDIDTVLSGLKIPTEVKTAIYYNKGNETYTKLSFGKHEYSDFIPSFLNVLRGNADSSGNWTSFSGPMKGISSNICDTDMKLTIILLTDAKLDSFTNESGSDTDKGMSYMADTEESMSKIKEKCKAGTTLYMVSPSTAESLFNGSSLEKVDLDFSSSTIDILNKAIQENLCITQ